MTDTQEFVDFFKQHRIQADVRDDGNYAIIVITDDKVSDDVKYAFEIVRPAGIAVHYVVRDRNKIPVPSPLHKWWHDTAKAMK